MPAVIMSLLRQRIRTLEKRVEEFRETLEILSDKKTLRSTERGLRDLKLGKYRTYKSFDEYERQASSS